MRSYLSNVSYAVGFIHFFEPPSYSFFLLFSSLLSFWMLSRLRFTTALLLWIAAAFFFFQVCRWTIPQAIMNKPNTSSQRDQRAPFFMWLFTIRVKHIKIGCVHVNKIVLESRSFTQCVCACVYLCIIPVNMCVCMCASDCVNCVWMYECVKSQHKRIVYVHCLTAFHSQTENFLTKGIYSIYIDIFMYTESERSGTKRRPLLYFIHRVFMLPLDAVCYSSRAELRWKMLCTRRLSLSLTVKDQHWIFTWAHSRDMNIRWK